MALNVRATLNLDGRAFATGLMRAQQSLVAFGQRMASIFVTGYIASSIRRIAEELATIPEKAARLGMTTDEFQAMDHAAKQTGTSVEDIGRAMTQIAMAQKQALTGKAGNEALKNFESLGFAFERLRAMAPDDIMKALGQSIREGSIGLEKMAALRDILGRGYREFFLFMQQGGLDVANQFIANNRAIEADTLEMLDSLEDRWRDLIQTIKKGLVTAGEFVVKDVPSWWKDYLQAQYMYYVKGPAAHRTWFEQRQRELGEEQAKAQEEKDERKKQREGRVLQMRELARLEAGEMVPAEAKEKARAKFQVASDALAKIGGFTGLGGARSAEASLRKIEKNTDKTAMASKRLADALGNGL